MIESSDQSPAYKFQEMRLREEDAKEPRNGDVAVPRGEETCHVEETRTARFADINVEVHALPRRQSH